MIENHVGSLLDEIASLDLFAAAGNASIPTDGGVDLDVSSWEEAADRASGAEWEATRIAVRNFIAATVSPRDWPRYQQWTPLAERCKLLIEAVVADRIKRLDLRKEIALKVKHTANWDLLFAVIECSYADLIPIDFYRVRLLDVYRAGRFPYGWNRGVLSERFGGTIGAFRLLCY